MLYRRVHRVSLVRREVDVVRSTANNRTVSLTETRLRKPMRGIWVVMRQRLEVRLHDLLLLKLRLVIKALVGNGKTLKLVAF